MLQSGERVWGGAEVESNLACTYNHVGLPQNISSVGRCRPTPHWGNDSPDPRHFLGSPPRPPALTGSRSHPTPLGLGRLVTAGEQAGF